MSETVFNVTGRVMTMERVFDAPRERVWEAWSNPDILAKWWGPRGWETTIKAFDFKPGGIWHYLMKCVDKNQGEFYGMESWGKATFGEIAAPESFVYTDEFADAEGNTKTDMPSIEITMKFEETADGKTKVTSASEFASEADVQKVVAMGVEQGAKETWDRLAEMLQG